MSNSDVDEQIDLSDSENSHTPPTSTAESSIISRPPRLPVPVTPIAPTSPGLKSPSSPDFIEGFTLPRPAASRSLTRSNTLPRISDHNAISDPKKLGLYELVVEPDVLAKIRRWIIGLVIVDFDLEVGPVVQSAFPHMSLTPSDAENIAFSSFPDSLQFDQGSQVHSFRIRDYSEKNPDSYDGFMYGYSHFTQKRKTNAKRGYQQQSLVILTYHQYPALFSALTATLGPLYQIHGITILEAVCHSIANWISPTPGSTIELGFLGSVIHVELPQTLDSQQLTETSSFGEKYDPKYHILASSAPLIPPPLALFEAALPHLWSIWECLVLCEPILIYGPSPAMTSQAIWWFRDLLRPIPLANDIRPYFTIHDKDHDVIVNKLPPKAGVLLGVTNPFFERSCAHWPHELSLGRRLPTRNTIHAAAGPAPGWKTKTHKRYISKDRLLLKKLENACKGNEQSKMEASLLLRSHFTTRTTALLMPLHRYVNTLIPPPTEYTSSSHRLKPFNSANFFTSLGSHGSQLPFRSKSKQKEFYERWLRTPFFGLWLAQQEEVVQHVLQEKA